MKITVKEKRKEEPQVLAKDLPFGTVFLNPDRVTVLKLRYNNYVMLDYSDGCSWLDLRTNLTLNPVKEVLGIISEVIVEKL